MDEEQQERTRREYVSRIESGWQKSIDAIFEVGRLLIEAKEHLGHGKFVEMIGNDLPFRDSTAQKLMKVAKDQRLLALAQTAKALPAPEESATEHQGTIHVTPKPVLPASWRTLYELTQLTDDQFRRAMEEGLIHSNLEQKAAIRLKRIPTGRPDLTVRGVKQPPREGRSEILPVTTMAITPAEALILDLLYRNAVEFGRVHEWVAQNWPQEGESPLKAVEPLNIEGLKTKLARIVATLGL
ncbi:MAG: DUF3102 domain-containing protein [Magnetococcales bacterium]|nr:DUF3102 domain-containing protein [Magnetococcales bacterium]